jgi:uncharacterized protein DUF2381
VLPALCGLVALVSTLAGSPEDPLPSQVISPEMRSRQVVIPEVTSTPAARVRLAPGFISTFRFHAPLDPAAVVLEGPPELFVVREVGTSTVTLEPGAALPSDGLTLTVGFADGLPPARASFTLVPADSEVDVQVRVIRPAPRSESPASPGEPRASYEAGLLARLVLSGRVGKTGVTFSLMQGTSTGNTAGEVDAEEQCAYRSDTLTVVAVRLKLSATAPRPWVPDEAWLLDAEGHAVGRFPVWMESTRLDPGQERHAAVEMELAPGAHAGSLWLELREKDGGRTVRLGELRP